MSIFMYLYVYVLYVCTHLISIEYNLHLLLDIIAYGFPIYWQIPIEFFGEAWKGMWPTRLRRQRLQWRQALLLRLPRWKM